MQTIAKLCHENYMILIEKHISLLFNSMYIFKNNEK